MKEKRPFPNFPKRREGQLRVPVAVVKRGRSHRIAGGRSRFIMAGFTQSTSRLPRNP